MREKERNGKNQQMKKLLLLTAICVIVVLLCLLFLPKPQKSQPETDFTPEKSVDIESDSNEQVEEYYQEMQVSGEEQLDIFKRAEWERPEEQLEIVQAEPMNGKNPQHTEDAYLEYIEQMQKDPEEPEQELVIGKEHTILDMLFTPCNYMAIAKTAVNTRKEPSVEAQLGDIKLTEGQVVHIIAESEEGWLQIENENNTYYIRQDTVISQEVENEYLYTSQS